MSPKKKPAPKKKRPAPKKRPAAKKRPAPKKRPAAKKVTRKPLRDARGRFVSRETLAVQRGRFTREQESILDDVRKRLRGKKEQGRGQEYELTVRYAKGRRDSGAVTAKIRVRALRKMPAETARLLLDRAIRDGIMPPGLEVSFVDWARPGRNKGYVYEGGMVPSALRKLYHIVHAPGSQRRFERIAVDAEGQG